MQSGMNSQLKIIPFLDIRLLNRVLKAIRKDEAMKKQIEERIQILNECDIPEFQEILKQTSQLHYRILFSNSLAKNPFLLFSFLLVVVCEIFKTFTFSLRNIMDKFVNRRTKNKPDDIIGCTEGDLRKFAQTAGLENIA